MSKTAQEGEPEISSGMVNTAVEVVAEMLRGMRQEQAAEALRNTYKSLKRVPLKAAYASTDVPYRLLQKRRDSASDELLNESQITEIVEELSGDEDAILPFLGALHIEKTNEFTPIDKQQDLILDTYTSYLNQAFEKISHFGGPVATRDFLGSTDILIWKPGTQITNAATRSDMPFEKEKSLELSSGYQIYQFSIQDFPEIGKNDTSNEDNNNIASQIIENLNLKIRQEDGFNEIEQLYKSGIGFQYLNIYEGKIRFTSKDLSRINVPINTQTLSLKGILLDVENAIRTQSRHFNDITQNLLPNSS